MLCNIMTHEFENNATNLSTNVNAIVIANTKVNIDLLHY